METKISIVQFLFAKDWKVLSESLGANPSLNSHKFETASDILKFCSTEQSCLVIANVGSKDDLIQLATFVKAARRSLKGTVLKIVVLNSTDNKQFEKAISKLGSVEILEPSVNVKALRFKMDFWMKAMKGQAKKLGSMTQKTLEAANTEATQETKNFIQNPPLDCENDIWLLSRESDCKRIIGRWMVKLMGPSPYVGAWNEVPNRPGVWSFQIKKTFSDQFVNGNGNWLYKGEQKPEFNWQENRWMFTGDDFELFYFDGVIAQSRVKLSAKVLSIAGNSLFAKTKESLIIDTFNKDLVFRTEADLLKGQTLDFDNEGDLGGHVEGKLKGHEENGKGHLEGKLKDVEASQKGHLEGKVADKEEAKGNLRGDVEEGEVCSKGHLEGKVKDQEPEKNDLKGRIKNEESSEVAKEKSASAIEKEKQSSRPLKEKQESSATPQEHKKREQVTEEIASKWKGKTGAAAESRKADSEDHKQHNEKLSGRWGGKTQEYTAEENPKKERNERGISAQIGKPELKGKSEKTDHLEAHWGGKASSDTIDADGVSAPGTSEVHAGSLLDLKKTDHTHQTHYKNHNEAAQYEAGEMGKHLHHHDNEGNSLGGKTSTDKLASHYGTGHKSESLEPNGKAPLAGASETDKISAHLGRKNIDRPSEEHEEETHPSSLSGKSRTEKINSHYGSGKKKKTSPDSEIPSEFEEVINELADRTENATNILPFAIRPEEEKELEKLTASTSMECFITQNNQKYECKLDDYFENNVIFICQGEGLRNSEKAQLAITLDYQSESAKVNCEGQVMSIDQDGLGGFFVTIEVSPTDSKMFDHVMDLLKSRQENIQSFMQKARGF
jgi:hypothetical protein